jgi:hypothetical protein
VDFQANNLGYQVQKVEFEDNKVEFQANNVECEIKKGAKRGIDSALGANLCARLYLLEETTKFKS